MSVPTRIIVVLTFSLSAIMPTDTASSELLDRLRSLSMRNVIQQEESLSAATKMLSALQSDADGDDHVVGVRSATVDGGANKPLDVAEVTIGQGEFLKLIERLKIVEKGDGGGGEGESKKTVVEWPKVGGEDADGIIKITESGKKSDLISWQQSLIKDNGGDEEEELDLWKQRFQVYPFYYHLNCYVNK